MAMLQFGIPQASELPGALAILSSMLTPSVLILACGSLLTTTSHRLGRVMDRARQVSERFTQLMRSEPSGPMFERERELLFQQVQNTARRANLLQRAMLGLYISLGIFVATSVAIGLLALSGQTQAASLSFFLGLGGVVSLFYSATVLISESRIASHSVQIEMDFVLELSRNQAPAQFLEGGKRR